jgi:hypothetical protein
MSYPAGRYPIFPCFGGQLCLQTDGLMSGGCVLSSSFQSGHHDAAERVRHQTHAATDAEHRARHVEQRGSQRGAPASDTLWGPPDRMIPAGARARIVSAGVAGEPKLRVYRQLPQAPGDELCVSRSEIENADRLRFTKGNA